MIGYFLPTILALGIWISWEDYKKAMIRNKLLMIGAGIGIFTYAILALFQVVDWLTIVTGFGNGAAALLVGFVVWKLNWWSAGDAKLYGLMAFLVPPSTYRYTSTQLPAIDLLVNSLLPIFFYLLVVLIIKTTKKQKYNAFIETIRPKKLAYSITAIFGIGWVLVYLFAYTSVRSNFLLNILLIFIILRLVEKVLKEQTFGFLILVCVMRLFFNTKHYTTKNFLVSFIIMVLLYIIVFGLVRRLAEMYRVRKHLSELKPGDCLAEGILRNGQKAEFGKIKDEKYFVTKKTGLNEQDIKIINKFHRTGKIHFNKIQTYQTIIFGPFLLLGTLITIISQGNVIMFLRAVSGI